MMGTALFAAYEICLGPEVWTEELSLAWAKMFSMMLDMILPYAVEVDRKMEKRHACRKLCRCLLSQGAQPSVLEVFERMVLHHFSTSHHQPLLGRRSNPYWHPH
jgi:hypothetical protein